MTTPKPNQNIIMVKYTSKHFPKIIKALKLFGLLFIVVAFGRAACNNIKYEPITNDAVHHLAMAINFFNHGTFSLDNTGNNVNPTAFRLPAYPLFLSLGMHFLFDRGEIKPSDAMQTSQLSLQERLNKLKYSNVLIYMLLIVFTFIAGYMLTHNYAISLVACLCLAQSRNLLENINFFLTEGLTSLLLVVLSLSMAFLQNGRRKFFAYAAAGGLLAMLTLSNPVYFYFFPPALLLLWLGARSANIPFSQALRRISVFALIFVLLTGAWMARNYSHFDRFFLTERGGQVLSGRIQYNDMTMHEYLASFLYWTDNDITKRLLNRYFSYEEYRNLDLEYENSYYARTIAHWNQLLKQTGSQVETDKLFVAEGWQGLLKRFPKHLAVTVPFAYRGIFVSSRLNLWDDVYIVRAAYVCYLLFLSFFVLTIHSLQTRNFVVFTFLAPSLFSYAFYSFFTHNISRYNTPMLPVLWIATIIVLHRYVVRHIPRAAGRLFHYCRMRACKASEDSL